MPIWNHSRRSGAGASIWSALWWMLVVTNVQMDGEQTSHRQQLYKDWCGHASVKTHERTALESESVLEVATFTVSLYIFFASTFASRLLSVKCLVIKKNNNKKKFLEPRLGCSNCLVMSGQQYWEILLLLKQTRNSKHLQEARACNLCFAFKIKTA